MHFEPDSAILLQWEQKLIHWIKTGKSREQIILEMTAANWAFDDAERLIRRISFEQKRKYVIWICVYAAGIALGIALAYAMLSGRPARTADGGEGIIVYLPILCAVGFVHSLVRLVKIKV